MTTTDPRAEPEGLFFGYFITLNDLIVLLANSARGIYHSGLESCFGGFNAAIRRFMA